MSPHPPQEEKMKMDRLKEILEDLVDEALSQERKEIIELIRKEMGKMAQEPRNPEKYEALLDITNLIRSRDNKKTGQ